MDRRTFLTSAAVAALGGHALGQNCGPLPGYPYPAFASCTAEVDIDAAIREQGCDEHCWAACMQMIFALNGHDLSQERIARQALTIADTIPDICGPIRSSKNYRDALSRKYTDDEGDTFQVTLNAFFDAADHTSSLDNQDVVDALNAGRALIYCNRMHAIVNYKMTYKDGPYGIVPGEIWVADPLGTKRKLSWTEMRTPPAGVMTFLADVTVT